MVNEDSFLKNIVLAEKVCRARGKKHREENKEFYQKPISTYQSICPQTNRPLEEDDKQEPITFLCEICDVLMMRPIQALQHFSGKIHLRNIGKKTEKPNQEDSRKRSNQQNNRTPNQSTQGPSPNKRVTRYEPGNEMTTGGKRGGRGGSMVRGRGGSMVGGRGGSMVRGRGGALPLRGRIMGHQMMGNQMMGNQMMGRRLTSRGGMMGARGVMGARGGMLMRHLEQQMAGQYAEYAGYEDGDGYTEYQQDFYHEDDFQMGYGQEYNDMPPPRRGGGVRGRARAPPVNDFMYDRYYQ